MRPVLSAIVLAAATSGLVALAPARAEPPAAPTAKVATKTKRPAKRRARVVPGGGGRPRAAVEPSSATHRRTPSLPSGYVSGLDARRACEAAGKRLCRETEWVTACRGEEQTAFPYGASYRQDSCNVFREDHPARLLHGSASRGHLDPRLNLVEVKS